MHIEKRVFVKAVLGNHQIVCNIDAQNIGPGGGGGDLAVVIKLREVTKNCFIKFLLGSFSKFSALPPYICIYGL